jgi:VanZ family protein
MAYVARVPEAPVTGRQRRVWLGVYVVVLLVLTLAPLPPLANRLASRDQLDKVVHFVLLAGLTVMLYWNLAVEGHPPLGRVVGPATAFAALIELLQAPLPYRTMDFWDFVSGMVGAFLAYFVVARLTARR